MDKKSFGKSSAVETYTVETKIENKIPLIQVNKGHVENSVREILEYIGEDSEREGLLKTPNRVARMLDELTSGYHTNPEKLINGAIFSADYDEMVIVNDIEFYSKIPRIVDMFARRLQIQEQMTSQIAEFLGEAIDAKGVAVVVEGSHMCSMMRGVKKQDSRMRTIAMTGDFKEDKDLRREFLNQIPAS
jgi:GTP cyclohydrolase I